MYEDSNAYRISGVACMITACERCERATEHGINFLLDAERKRKCFLGCCDCGADEPLSESVYEELYEASFEYDAWRAGEIDFEAFRERMPEGFRDRLYEKLQEVEVWLGNSHWQCLACGEKSPMTISQCWKCGYENAEVAAVSYEEPVEAEIQAPEGEMPRLPMRVVSERPIPERVARAKPELIRLTNGMSAPLGFGLLAGVISCGFVVGLRYLVEIPSVVELFTSDLDTVRWANRFEPFISGALSLVLGTVLGTWLSLPRFPKRVTISSVGIEVSGRGGKPAKLHGYGSVRRARFTEEGRYLTLIFADGGVVVVEMGRTTCEDLRGFFRGRG